MRITHRLTEFNTDLNKLSFEEYVSKESLEELEEAGGDIEMNTVSEGEPKLLFEKVEFVHGDFERKRAQLGREYRVVFHQEVVEAIF